MGRNSGDRAFGWFARRLGLILTVALSAGWLQAEESSTSISSRDRTINPRTQVGSGEICSSIEVARFLYANIDSPADKIDRRALTHFLHEILEADVPLDEVRIVDLLDRTQALCKGSGRPLTRARRRAIIALARELTGRQVPVGEIRIGDLLDRVDAVRAKWAGEGNAAPPRELIGRIRKQIGSVERADFRDPLLLEKQRLSLRYAAVVRLLKELRRGELGQADPEATYVEAYHRLFESGQREAIELLEGHLRLEEELASTDLSSKTRKERIEFMWDARRWAFRPEIADLLFGRDEAMERYEIDRLAIENDTRRTDTEKARQIGERRRTLKVELASLGTYVSFLDEGRAAVEAELRERFGDRVDAMSTEERAEAGRRIHMERLPLHLQEVVNDLRADDRTSTAPTAATDTVAATECDADPNAVGFQPTVDPSPLNDLLASLGDINIGESFRVSFNGVCVKHNIDVVTSGSIPVGGASFTVTPSPGSLKVDLGMGSLDLGLSLSGYSDSNCNTGIGCGLGAACALEAAAVEAAISGLSGSITADSIQLTQIADTCVLGDCTAVHPLASTNATLTNFTLDLFGSCNVLGFDPCALLNSAITSVTNWLLDIETFIEVFFVTPAGDGVLIEVFSDDIVSNGCLPIPEVTECRQSAGPAQAGLVRAAGSGWLNAVLYLLPLSVIAGAAWRLRHRRRN